MQHEPVLLSEVMTLLQPHPGDVVCDTTLGLGGHALAFLKHVAPGGRLIGIDADRENLEEARKRLAPYEKYVTLLHGNFRDLPSIVSSPVDVLFADLGLSSPHLNDPARGFSFRIGAPLDMRFDQSQGLSAAEWIVASDEGTIAEALREWGELRRPRALAAAIARSLPKTTTALQQCVEEVLGWRAKAAMAQVFQALRIAVNDEITSLKMFLATGVSLLRPRGRFGVISFHSLEDRLVKQAFRALATVEKDPETGQDIGIPPFAVLTKKAVVPSEAEIAKNPRARSAKLRVIEKAS